MEMEIFPRGHFEGIFLNPTVEGKGNVFIPPYLLSFSVAMFGGLVLR